MLNAVIRFSLKYRLLIVFLCLIVIVYGTYAMATLPIDVLPDLDRPRVTVITEAPGYAPGDVETHITFPLESLLNGANGVESVRSQSGPSVSVIYVNFNWGVDIYTARQIVQERLNNAKLPDNITPQMTPISSLMGQILLIGLHREPGPLGGRLASLSDTDYVAELLTSSDDGKVTLQFWDRRDEDGKLVEDEHDWRPMSVSFSTVTLKYTRQETDIALDQEPQAKNKPESAISAAQRGEITLSADPGHTGRFIGNLSSWKNGTADTLEDYAFRTSVYLDGKLRSIDFPTVLQAQMELRTLADWVFRLRLLKVPGVAQVVAIGGGRKQYQVLVDPTALVRYDVTLEQVKEALEKNNVAGSAGWAEKGDKEQPIRFLGRLGPTTADTLEQLERIPVKTTSKRTILLRQVARIVEQPQIKRGDASINGYPGVVLMVTKQPHVDTRDLTTKIIAAIDELKPSLPPGVVVNSELFQLKRFIDLGVYNVAEALVIGAALVLIILFLFLLNFRTTFISLTAIPLSLAITAVVFKSLGLLTGTELSINIMTLGGIAVAMGELVDDAIVDVENIFRRLRENNLLAQPRPITQVIYEASVEIRSAIVYGTIMVILVFLPLFFLSGIEGRLFAPLGVAYIVSILASLLVSLTVTPVLSYYLLPNAKATHRTKDSPLLRLLKWFNSYLIRFSMNHAGLLLLSTWILVGVCVWMLMQLGTDFLPPFDEGSMQVNVTLPAGSSLEASNQVARQVDARFRQMQKSPDNPQAPFLDFVRRTGRAELDEHVEPVGNTEYILTINPDSPLHREELKKLVLDELNELQLGADVEAEQPLAHLISHMVSGVTAQIAIRIYGDDLNVLRQLAQKVKNAISDVPGIAKPVIEAQQLAEEIHIEPRMDALAEFGVDKQHVLDFVRTAMYGTVVSEVIEGERRFDLLVRLDDPFRKDYGNLKRLTLELPQRDHALVSLGMLADVREGVGPNTVNRDNVRRRIVIRVNTQGRDLGSVVNDITERVAKEVRLPEGYFVEYGGQFESQQHATFMITALASVSIIAMFVVLYMLYPSWRIVLQILNALPTAFIGGVLALVITGQTLTVASMVGFISLGGIAVRNGILLVSHYVHLMKYEGESFSKEMILRGSLERLSPVLMTALTAGIALLPLILGGLEPGREILYPVATVIFGGLITSTFCEFLIHPGLFWKFSGTHATRLVEETKEDVHQGLDAHATI